MNGVRGAADLSRAARLSSHCVPSVVCAPRPPCSFRGGLVSKRPRPICFPIAGCASLFRLAQEPCWE
eukprot:6476845-Pyramimonas_sp.AAC.1